MGYDPDVTDRARTRALTAAIGTIFLVGVVVLAWNVPLPLVAYSPGPVTDATDSVTVEGAPTYDTQGELVMLTVAGQDINAFEALVAAVDPSVDVLARQVVRRPDESDEDYHRRNLELMDQSVQAAITVALSRVDLPDSRPCTSPATPRHPGRRVSRSGWIVASAAAYRGGDARGAEQLSG